MFIKQANFQVKSRIGPRYVVLPDQEHLVIWECDPETHSRRVLFLGSLNAVYSFLYHASFSAHR